MLSALVNRNQSVVGHAPTTEESLAYLVHDMRSVATSVSLMVDLLELAAKAGDDTVQHARAVSAQISCNQIAMLCAEIAKHASGPAKATDDCQKFELAQTLEELHLIYQPVFELAGKSLNLEIETGETHVFGVQSRILRAVSNLVDNALKHTSKGSVVNVSCATTGEKVFVSVSDDGPGLPELEPRMKRHIHTLPVVIKHIVNSGAIFSPGTGLRYVSETMASIHGESTVESNERGGCSFKLTFPKHRSE